MTKVKIPPNHVCAGDSTFSNLKKSVGKFTSMLMYISEKTPFKIYLPVLRKLMTNVKVPSHIEIEVIERPDYKIERIMHKELKIKDSETKTAQKLKTLFYYHGGGMAAGSPKTVPLAFLKEQPDVQVFSVDYRFAPEVPFPGAINDCIDATRFILNSSEKYEIGEFSIFGESAGGNLVLATMMEIDFQKEFGEKPVTAHAAVPMGQMLRFDTPSYMHADNQFELDRKLCCEFWLWYSGISLDETGKVYTRENRELLKKGLHLDESIRNDQEFMSRADHEKLLVLDESTEKFLPENYKSDKIEKQAEEKSISLKTQFRTNLVELLKNKLFSPGTAKDSDL